ncbi:Valine--tRNA ligase, mitochondrial [Komagataella phaffii]|uniref:Valine--tRNA ligase, mitochondrial n=2 Tax=Komagataella phaffii TaxID=460519 RepID=C4R5G8_KOMPG|nr:Mitochondrial and cytoplasmic valyl-tRNA synthetase [Komagataella phaffii GS115]AOA63904.1 GQ67_03851T0 [Komagataella phaffii]AOA68496.1 GQ68_03824T0 [Komagataella phaffii GS115]CAY70804.1 Mitochondrial and cytoplasmic valyl-tRNA synthetase [Komagataella phaffii GS115]
MRILPRGLQKYKSLVTQIHSFRSTSMSTVPESNIPPKVKTEKELEKERKKAEKLAKFEAKKAKQEALKKNQLANAEKKTKKEKKPVEEVSVYVDQTPKGEKKILASLEDPAFKAYNPKNVESSWYEWWVKEGLFEPEFGPDGKPKPAGVFSIPAPPPNITGALHIGHALTIALQDTLIRFYRMKGKTTLYLPGFDHAGIATQSVVEKSLWAQEGKTRHDLGREKFIEKVWDWKDVYQNRIRSQFEKLGASYDFSREAFTLNPMLSKAVTEAFVRLHEDGTIYRAQRLVNWSVKLNTAISNIEVENKIIPAKTAISVPGYENKIEFGVLHSFAYPVVGSDEKLIVATTRPETVFGDTGVAVHPDDPRYKHLHGKFVQHPLLDRQIPIVTDAEAVDMEFGTGAVKITPGHDNNDYNTGKRQKLEFINIFTDDGYLNENCGKYKGLKRFDARQIVIDDLKALNLYEGEEPNEMTIPTCSRSGDIIEPYLKPQWWVAQDKMAAEAIKAVKDGRITITPKVSESEYFRWLENIQDWCISRQLWWGHRCPVYFVNIEGEVNDENDGQYWVSGRSLEEAQEKASAKFAGKIFTLEQDEDVLDTWFSSGLWPFSTLGWPDNTPDMKQFYPFSMLETGWDILFFWVTRMILLGLKLTGDVPFKEVFCHSLVRDAQGRKMSKSLGNVVDPLDVINGISLEDLHAKLLGGNLDPREVEKAKKGQKESYPSGIPECGTDALRFALCAYTTGGRDINLDILRVEGYRKFCNKIYQATKFVLMRLGDDYKPPATGDLTGKESLVERWILHKLSKASKVVNESIEKRDFFEATNAIYQFWLYELCDVYIENSKYLITEGTADQKKSAQDTLFTCIDAALKLIHPFMPFLTEEMWQRLPRREAEKSIISISKAPYPEYNPSYDDISSESNYEQILEITRAARSLFAQYGITKEGKLYIESADAAAYKLASEEKHSIVSLIKPVNDLIVIDSPEKVPEGCALQSVTPKINAHILVKGQVDLDAEILKTQNKVSKVEKSLQALEKTLASSNYASKASKEIQEQDQTKKQNFISELEGLNATIANLQQLKL